MKVLQAKAHKKEGSAAGFRTIRRKQCSSPGAFNPIALLSRSAEDQETQAKLRVGAPGDKYEREADALAQRVVSETPSGPVSDRTSKLQRDEDEQAQTQAIQHEEEDTAQTKLQRDEDEQAQTQAIQQEEDDVAQTKLQRDEDEQAQTQAIQREEDDVAQTKLQRAPEEQTQTQVQMDEEEQVRASFVSRAIQKEDQDVQSQTIQRNDEDTAQMGLQSTENEEDLQKNASHTTNIQENRQLLSMKRICASRGPPAPLACISLKNDDDSAQAATQGNAANRHLETQLKQSKSSGRPMEPLVRDYMEERLSADFARIRIHTDDVAAQMCTRLGAKAFTRGAHVYFNQGRYDAETKQGKKLLAHELVHTIQQGASVRRKAETTVGKSGAIQCESLSTSTPTQETKLEDELAAANAEAVSAIDPKPAEQAKQQALKDDPELKEKKAQAVPAPQPEEAEGPKARPKPALKPRPRPTPVAPEGEGKEGPERGVVGQYLEQVSAGVYARAAHKTRNLADNQKTHDDADAKHSQIETAVKPPAQEGQAQSNAEQIEGLEQARAVEPNDQKAKAALSSELNRSVPKSIKALNEFKSQGKAKIVGRTVLGKVKEDTDAVQNTYNKIETAPAPKPQPKPPVELPGEEIAPETPQLGLGKNAVPALKPEHTDFTEFDRQSDSMLDKEGISEKQLEMVDEGELYEAQKERKGLKEKVTEQPAQLQEFAAAEVQQVDKTMEQEEKASRAEMGNKRKKNLAATRNKQSKTKTALELKREVVTKKINTIYEKAKTSVTTKLNNLEKASLAAFDRGQEKASQEFENEVNRDINAWKSRRYSGAFGGLKWVKDKLVGIDDFPEVKQAFERGKNNFVTKIDRLILVITQDSQKVIKACKEEMIAANKEITVYVETLGPELKATGKQAMGEMKSKLAEMDKFIDRKNKELVQKLADKKEQAIKKIDEKIEKMKEAMSGALAKLGNFLLEAMLKFFKWALKKAGYNATQLMGIISKGKAVIKKIVGDPIGFIMNIVNAVKTGINNFQANIKKHLIGGLLGWLTGQMGNIGIQLPEEFDLKGILSIVLQILGLTWTSIRQKLVKRLGEKVVRVAEKTVDIVKKIITEGPMALWKMIKAKAAEIKAKVMEGIRNWAIVELVKQGIIKLLSFLNPAGAIVQAILAIYNTIMFFVENWDRIVQFVKTVFNSIADMAMGRIGAAAAAVERALAMTIPIILSFLARLLNLGGIGKAVKKIIMKIRKPIDKVVNKVVGIIAKKAKGLLGKGKAVAKKLARKVKDFVFPKQPFKAGDETHTLTLDKKGKRAQLAITSSPARPVAEYLYSLRAKLVKRKVPKKKWEKKYYKKALKLQRGADLSLKVVFASTKEASKAKHNATAKTKQLLSYIKTLWTFLGVGTGLLKFEGEAKEHGKLEARSGLQRHHMPRDAVMKRLRWWLQKYLNRPEVPSLDKSKPSFRDSMVDRLADLSVNESVEDYTRGKGISMYMMSERHKQTRTYGPLPSESDLLIPNWKERDDKVRQIGNERIIKLVHVVKDEFSKDKKDVEAIYSGNKGMSKVKNTKKIGDGISAVSRLNKNNWGKFLA